MKYSLNQTLNEINQLHFTGNTIPHTWYKHIKFKNGKVDLISITILSEIVCWFRPKIIKDEHSGQFIGYTKQFKGVMLERSIASFVTQFGFSYRQASDSLNRLKKNGYILKETRSVKAKGYKVENTLLLAPVIEKLIEIQPKVPLFEPICPWQRV